MLSWFLGKLRDDTYGRRSKMTNVDIGLWYNSSAEMFLVGYGVQHINHIGFASDLDVAFERLAESISSSETQRNVVSKIRDADDCGLEIEMYYLRSNDDYLVQVTDLDGDYVCGVGNSSSDAFVDLAEHIIVETSD
jgi:hypothetical protein